MTYGRKALGESVPKKPRVSSAKRLPTAKRHDFEFFKNMDLRTLRITMKRLKGRDGTLRCVYEVSGAKSLVERFQAGFLTYNSEAFSFTPAGADKTKWVTMDVFDDTEDGVPQLQSVPAAIASPVGQQTPVYNNALRQQASAERSPASTESPVAPRTLRPARLFGQGSVRQLVAIAAGEVEDSDNEDSSSGSERPCTPLTRVLQGLELPNDPYEGITDDVVSDKLWSKYPNYTENTRSAREEMSKISDNAGIDPKVCNVCESEKVPEGPRAGRREVRLRCMGTMGGYRCQAWAHRVCAVRFMFACRCSHCSSSSVMETCDLIFLYYHKEVLDARKDKKMDLNDKKYRLKYLNRSANTFLMSLSDEIQATQSQAQAALGDIDQIDSDA